MNILYLELTSEDLEDPRVAPPELQERMLAYQKMLYGDFVIHRGGIYRKNEVILYYTIGSILMSCTIKRNEFVSTKTAWVPYAGYHGGSNDPMQEFKEIYGQAFIDAALKVDTEKFNKDIEEILKGIGSIK